WKVALLAAIPLAAAQILINFAFASSSVASVLFVTALVPFTTALFAWVALGENIAARSVIAMVIALAGAAFVAGSGIAQGRALGVVFAVCATLAIATFNLVLRAGRDAEMLPTVATSSVMASVVAGLILGFGAGDFSVSQYDFMMIIAMGAGSLGAGLVFFTLAVRERPVAEMALLMQIEVVLTPIWVWLGVGEVPKPATLIGGGLILCALGFSISREFRHRRTDTAVRH
ncbi:MAG: DMT family transporter, partial [Hyphomicrobiales bacterium]